MDSSSLAGWSSHLNCTVLVTLLLYVSVAGPTPVTYSLVAKLLTVTKSEWQTERLSQSKQDMFYNVINTGWCPSGRCGCFVLGPFRGWLRV